MASLENHEPNWHGDLRTPFIGGKYIDPKSGALQTMIDYVKEHDRPNFYLGPPTVDIVVQNIHAALRLLFKRLKLAKERKLDIDSVMAAHYVIWVSLCHELTKDEFAQIPARMANSLWDENQ
ncbi:unnamed protein product [Clonostachys solani]|uniref:Uncharacterized protein n=1 Tax=Clonostachys solani TaxID=160281 RepID=A0A9P0EHX7_9HYPO|nr:unnamed protein product [Clonostachys solani]